MITQQDLQFHTPADVPFDWAETYFFDIHIPEDNVHGFVYFVFRAGVGAVACEVQFWDTVSDAPHDALYIDLQHHLPLPERMDSFELPNGVRLHAKSPTEYRVDYVGVDDTEVHLDYKGVCVPYDFNDPDIDPMAAPAQTDEDERLARTGFGSAYASHFDLPARVKGHVVIRGTRHEVDTTVTMDHSWGPRPERGMGSMAWINANFDDLQMQAVWKFSPGIPGQEHEFAHGLVVVDGELRGCVAGTMRVERDGILGTRFEMTLTDHTGAAHHVTGLPLVNRIWAAYGCCPAPVAMAEWRTDDGRVGSGTVMEAMPLDTWTGGKLAAALGNKTAA